MVCEVCVGVNYKTERKSDSALSIFIMKGLASTPIRYL